MEQSKRRATQADVAKLSGFSTATVSYVLNGVPGQAIPEATRVRVLEVARQLDYVPSTHAQALARGSSRTVIVSLGDLPREAFVDQLARDVSDTLEADGRFAVIDDSRGPDRSRRLIALAQLISPEAIVTFLPLPEALGARLADLGLGRQVSIVRDDDALADLLRLGPRRQVEYLAGRQHRSVCYWGTAEPQLSSLDEIRRDSVAETARRFGMEFMATGGTGSLEAAAEMIGDAAARVTSVAAFNDETAMIVLTAAWKAGVRVPEDLAVIGVDDLPSSRWTVPPLTTVSYNLTHTPSSASAPALLRESTRPRIVAEFAANVGVVERAST